MPHAFFGLQPSWDVVIFLESPRFCRLVSVAVLRHIRSVSLRASFVSHFPVSFSLSSVSLMKDASCYFISLLISVDRKLFKGLKLTSVSFSSRQPVEFKHCCRERKGVNRVSDLSLGSLSILLDYKGRKAWRQLCTYREIVTLRQIVRVT